MRKFREPPPDTITSSTNDHSFQRAVYPGSTCATCQAPLDTSEQLLNIVDPDLRCTRDRSHLSIECAYCKKHFVGPKQLREHSGWHPTLQCIIQGCEKRLHHLDVSKHFRRDHPEIKHQCSQCGLQFDYQSQLDQHGEQTMHAAYVCHYPDCGSESCRMGDLNRHQLIHKKDVLRYPCRHCRK
jgi:general transcription factor IIIA